MAAEFKIDDPELESAIHKDRKCDQVHHETKKSDDAACVVFGKIVFLEHDRHQCRDQRDEQRRDFELVQVLETLAVGIRQDLRDDGDRDEVRDARDRDHAIEAMRTEYQKRDHALSQNDRQFPVTQLSRSVASIEEAHRLIRPAVHIHEVRNTDLEGDDEEDEQTAIDRTHEQQDEIAEQLRVGALMALDARVDGPVLGRGLLLDVRRVMHVDAEADAQGDFQ